MKLTKIKIDSLYGIEHLELDGKPIEIRGVKGVGKTSVIDSIRFALTNRSDRDYVIKKGKHEGEVLISTDTGVTVERKKRAQGSDYNKITEHGTVVKSPQTFINDIFTPLQLNPIEFANWDKNAQNRAILNLIEFEWSAAWIKEQFGELPRGVNYSQHILEVLEDIQAKNGDYWLRREEANRQELYKRQSIAEIAQKIPANYDLERWEKYNLAEQIKELQHRQKHNSEIDRAKVFKTSYDNKIRGLEADRDIEITAETSAINAERTSITNTIERLKAEIKAAEDKLLGLDSKLEDKKAIIISRFNEQVAKLDGDIKIAEKYIAKEKIEFDQLQAEIDEASRMKEFISEYKTILSMKQDCETLKETSEMLTDKIQLARTLPGKILQTATIPIDGLSVENGIPLINGLPISNLSGGERIELCVDITIAKQNNLQLILLDGVEALDDASREKLYQKCKAKGLQVIAARTTNDSEFTIVEL